MPSNPRTPRSDAAQARTLHTFHDEQLAKADAILSNGEALRLRLEALRPELHAPHLYSGFRPELHPSYAPQNHEPRKLSRLGQWLWDLMHFEWR